MNIPNDVLYIIISYINDPTTYRSLSLTNKRLNGLCGKFKDIMRKRFLCIKIRKFYKGGVKYTQSIISIANSKYQEKRWFENDVLVSYEPVGTDVKKYKFNGPNHSISMIYFRDQTYLMFSYNDYNHLTHKTRGHKNGKIYEIECIGGETYKYSNCCIIL